MRGDLGVSLASADEPEDERKVAAGLARVAMQELRAVSVAVRDVFQDAEQEIGTELRLLLEALTRSYAEMLVIVKHRAQFNVTNLRQGAHELSTDQIEAERSLLKTLSGRIAALIEPVSASSSLAS